jgi:enterochelin esterase-like enzyme
MTAVLVALALLAVGLGSAYSYWESYYQHRGFATVALVAGARRGHLVTVNFHSEALGREADYLVYLPPGYDPATHRYPVYYLLHGSPGRPQVYIAIADMGLRMDNLIAEHSMRPMILVYPDGRIGGSTYSDSEWANTPSGHFMSYVVDVVHNVDQSFATIPERDDRVIAGFSAGAFGATNIALHNLSLFASLQSWSGYYTETRSGVFAHASTADLAYNSPLDYVRTLAPTIAADHFRAFLFVGRDDEVSPQTKPFAVALAARGAVVSYALYNGGHDWELWHAHLNAMLVLASRDTLRSPPLGEGIATNRTPGVIPIPNGLGRHRRAQLRRTFPLVVAHRRHRHRHHHGRHRQIAPVVPQTAPGAGASGGASVLSDAVPAGAGLSVGELAGGLLLAFGSAALINLGFLLQHRALTSNPEGGLIATLRRAIRDRTWLGGQALGWIGFGAQIVAVAIAPLSLVQAFAAGGLALSVPLAAGFFSYRITRAQVTAVLLIAIALAVLPIGFSTARDRLDASTLATCAVAGALVALAISAVRAPPARAIAAGLFYGVADAAIKAVSLGWHAHGAAAVVSVWTAVAAAATFAGFVAFQSALQHDGAVSAISLMNALAALFALAVGLLALGESLGANSVAVVAHAVAIAVVLGCVPILAAAHVQLARSAEQSRRRDSSYAPALGAGYCSPR